MIKLLQRFEKKELIISEQAYFKNNFKRYYAKKNARGKMEFWAHSTTPSGTQFTLDYKESYYLGKFDNGWLKPDNFYQLPWDVQRSASRLFTEFMQRVDNGLN